ncbi:MAG: hypothetical protein DMG69_16160 [Acidobacteria bacterium]|nr:MAG: hypothetical protein DMG69_16160 [Acidobacteriota bacterium]
MCSLVVTFESQALAQKIKVIVDQDARGPGTSDQQAILVFLQSEKFEVLGITIVSGDQWVKEETQHVLRLLEIAERTDVPVVQGGEFRLFNSKGDRALGTAVRQTGVPGMLDGTVCGTTVYDLRAALSPSRDCASHARR